MKYKTLVLFAVFVAFFSTRVSAIENQAVVVVEDDKRIEMAIKKARDSLPKFFALYTANYPKTQSYKLKVQVTDEHGSEHLWVQPFRISKKGGFEGFIANQPTLVKSVKFKQLYEFKLPEVTDWGYVEDGIQYGSYTVCAMFETMDKALVRQYKEQYGFKCGD